MRVFIALELPEPFVDDLAAVARQLAVHVSGRYMKRDTYHVTLAFLGEIDEGTLRAALDAVDEACAGAGPIPLRASGLGRFGAPSDATLWLGLDPVGELTRLAEGVRERLGSHGVPFDKKAFRPHITLARRARIAGRPLPALAFPCPDEASRVTVFRSILDSSGATYKPLYTVELA